MRDSVERDSARQSATGCGPARQVHLPRQRQRRGRLPRTGEGTQRLEAEQLCLPRPLDRALGQRGRVCL